MVRANRSKAQLCEGQAPVVRLVLFDCQLSTFLFNEWMKIYFFFAWNYEEQKLSSTQNGGHNPFLTAAKPLAFQSIVLRSYAVGGAE